MNWNPRYLAYCALDGLTPYEALARDEDRWPGGRMTGFVLWVQECWAEWDRLHKHGKHHVRGSGEHAEFDAWLGCAPGSGVCGPVLPKFPASK